MAPQHKPLEQRDLRIARVNFDLVKKDCSGNGTNTKLFNTSHHLEVDLPAGFDPAVPSEKPCSFKRWVDFIRNDRQLKDGEAQHINLSRSQAQLLVDAAAVSVVTRKISLAHKEDIQDLLYPALSSIFIDQRGIFVRLNDCSPKDGVRTEPGDMAIHTIPELVLRLTTSKRARNAIVRELEDEHESVDLFCLPFDERFSAEKEYRVFCCPGTGQITGISQYQWHKPWIYANVPNEKRVEIVDLIMKGIIETHALIMNTLEPGDEQDERFRQQGFTFDVVIDLHRGFLESEKIRSLDCNLVELNVFGARSACGSCLFHWVTDMDLLYGETGDMEFRFTY